MINSAYVWDTVHFYHTNKMRSNFLFSGVRKTLICFGENVVASVLVEVLRYFACNFKIRLFSRIINPLSASVALI